MRVHFPRRRPLQCREPMVRACLIGLARGDRYRAAAIMEAIRAKAEGESVRAVAFRRRIPETTLRRNVAMAERAVRVALGARFT